jgi:hypothetical protein
MRQQLADRGFNVRSVQIIGGWIYQSPRASTATDFSLAEQVEAAAVEAQCAESTFVLDLSDAPGDHPDYFLHIPQVDVSRDPASGIPTPLADLPVARHLRLLDQKLSQLSDGLDHQRWSVI